MKHLVFPIVFFCLYSISVAQHDFSAVSDMLKQKQGMLGGNICMLIYKDGKIVYEKNIGKYNSSTVEPIASCSKWLTAALVMTFIEEGRLSLEDTIGKFLPVFTKYHKGNIKIKHCLSHTTGIQTEQISAASLLSRSKFVSLEQEVNFIAAKPMVAKPGDSFIYGNIGLNIAGRIMEVISGKDFETLFQTRLAKPLEMKQTTFRNGHAVDPSGGAVSSPADYMNFLTMILNKGAFKGKRILNENSIVAMQENSTEDVKVSYAPEQAMGLDYGFGEWIIEKDEEDNVSVVSSPGLFGTFPYIDLIRDYAAIVFVKTLRFKDRNQTYKLIKQSVDKCLVK